MRKYILLTVLLLAVAVCGLTLAHSQINHQKDDVTVTETVLAGDRAKAEGIELAVEVQSTQNILYWQIKTLLEEKMTSTTTFALNDYKNILRQGDIPQKLPIQLAVNFPYGGTGTSVGIDVNEEIGQTTANEMFHVYHMHPQMIIDAAAKTPSGTQNTHKMPLADYLDVMPLTLDYQEAGLKSDYNKNGEYMNYDYFQIPVPDDFCYEVDIEKNAQGRVNFYGACPASDDNFVVNSSGFIDGDMLYLAVSGMSKGFERVDQHFADIIPEQRGIHCIPLIDGIYMDFDHASVGFHLEEDEVVLQMRLSEDKKFFLLSTRDEDKIYFSVIDRETMVRTQKLPLIDADKCFLTSETGNGYAVVLMESGDFVWLKERDGKYDIYHIDTITALPEMKHYTTSIWNENFAVCCDGKRLAIATVGMDGYDERRASDSILQVFDKNRLIYAGLYENSLQGDMLDHDMDGSWLVQPVDVSFVH